MSKPDKSNVIHVEADLADESGKKLSDDRPRVRVIDDEYVKKENERIEALYGKFDPNSEEWKRVLERKRDSGRGLVITNPDGTTFTT